MTLERISSRNTSCREGGLKFETQGAVNLSPPSTGPYAGITIFLDPADKGKVQFKKDSNLQVTGTIYAPNGEVKFQHVDAVLGFADDDEEDVDDSESDDESDNDADDLWDANPTSGSIEAQIIARKLKIDKHSIVRINGTGIDLEAPYLGIVE